MIEKFFKLIGYVMLATGLSFSFVLYAISILFGR